MEEQDLFEKAYIKASNTSNKLPSDIMLRLYALYKQAIDSEKVSKKQQEFELTSAFKLNARMQVKHLSKEEAKKEYIKIVNKYIEN